MLKRDSFYDENISVSEEEDSVCEPMMFDDVPLDQKPAAKKAPDTAAAVAAAKAAAALKASMKDPEELDRMINIAASKTGPRIGGPSLTSSNIDTIDADLRAKSQARNSISGGAAVGPSMASTLSSMDQDIAAKARARQEARTASSTPGVTSSTALTTVTPTVAPVETDPITPTIGELHTQMSDHSLTSPTQVTTTDTPVVAEDDQQPLIDTEWLPGDDYLPGDEFPEESPNPNNIEFSDNPNAPPPEGVNEMDQALLAVTVDPVLEGDVILDDDPKKERRKVIRNACICLVCFIIISISIAVPISIQQFTRVTEMPTSMPSAMPSTFPSAAPTTESFSLYMEALYPISGNDIFYNRSSPQYKALYWLYYHDSTTTMNNLNFTQRYILAVFYYSTNGDTWLYCSQNDVVCKDGKAHYLDVQADECEWYGNFCGDGWRITSLQFATATGMNMTGTLPDEVTHLTNLEGLFLINNPGLTGTIPDKIGNLKNLTRIYLYSNHLESPLPKSLFNLNLKALSLYDNYFEESLPEELGKMKQLEELTLSANFFKGGIPKEIGDMVSLKSLILLQNKLTGKIPKSIYNLQNLTEINLSYNLLTGTLETLGSELKVFKVANNSLTGPFPTIDGSNLKELDLSRNKFTGNVPNAIASLSLLNEVRLEYNDLTGTISQSICKLRDEKLEILTVDCKSKMECDYPTCCTECF